MRSENREQTGEKLDLRILLADFLKTASHWWLLALVLMLLFGSLFALQARHSYWPVYEASATFTVYVADPLQSEIRGYNTATAEQMAKTFPYILTSSALKDMVKRDLGISSLPSVQASVLNNTNIFTMYVRAGNPQLAYDVLNSVMVHYPDVAEFVVGPTVMNLLDESGVPLSPVNTLNYGAAMKKGALVALALWIAGMLLLTLTRSSVHNEEELRQLLNVKCLGTLPIVKGWHKNKTCPNLQEEGCETFAEAVRLLRVRTEKALREREQKVLLVSSATPGEGKTTVSINLAMSLAQKGYTTLLVDCDLRNPSVARNLKLSNRAGLADFLEGKLKAGKVVKSTQIPKLFVTVAGGPVEHAAELLAKERSRAFLRACKTTFDYVILDTPPSSMLADALEIASAADGALLVIRQNYAAKSAILEGAQLLTDSGVPLIGCVLNNTTGHSPQGYNGYYGYGYGHYAGTEKSDS